MKIKKWLLLSSFAVLLSTMSGCSSPRGGAKPAEPLPPQVQAPKEKVTVTEVATATQPSTAEIPVPLIVAAGEVGKALLKWLAKEGSDLLASYAESQGASYRAKAILADYQTTGEGGSLRYYYVFRRTLVFTNQAAAASAFAGKTNWIAGTFRETNGSFEVDAVSVPFLIRTTPSKFSLRFMPFVVPDTNASYKDKSWGNNWPFATNIIFQARKANAPQKPVGDSDLKLAVSARLRFAANIGGLVTERTNEPAVIMLDLKALNHGSTNWLETDWQPAPQSEAYSIQVDAVESTQMQELIKKAADALASVSGNTVDKSVDQAVKDATTTTPPKTK